MTIIVSDMTNEGINEWVGRKVESVIKESGVKKTAVTAKTGMPYSTLNSKIKAHSAFTVDELYRIAIATGTDPMELIPPQFSAGKAA